MWEESTDVGGVGDECVGGGQCQRKRKGLAYITKPRTDCKRAYSVTKQSLRPKPSPMKRGSRWGEGTQKGHS